MSFHARALVSGQEEMQDRSGIENVPAPGLNSRHATEEVGIPERQASERPDVLDEELAEHDARGDRVLAHQHAAGSAQQILAEEQQGQRRHGYERRPPRDLIQVG